jgi:hypothetical protein
VRFPRLLRACVEANGVTPHGWRSHDPFVPAPGDMSQGEDRSGTVVTVGQHIRCRCLRCWCGTCVARLGEVDASSARLLARVCDLRIKPDADPLDPTDAARVILKRLRPLPSWGECPEATPAHRGA